MGWKKKMKNKYLIEVVVPDLEEKYNVFIPVNKKVGNVAILLSKVVGELSAGVYKENNQNALFSGTSGQKYDIDQFIRDTDIQNGSRVILM